MHTATADAAWMNRRYMHAAAAAAASMRACAAAHACVIDTVYQLSFFTRRRRPSRRGESNFRIEISTYFGNPLGTYL